MLLTLQRREHLKSVLLEKLKMSFGHCRESVIEKEVENFARRAKVTDANLARLERRVRYQAQMEEERGYETEEFDEEVDGCSSIPYDAVSSYSLVSLASSALGRSASTPNMHGRLEKRSGHGLPSSYNWARLDSYAQFLQQHEEERKKEGEMETRRKLRDQLQSQMAERTRIKQERAHFDQQYSDNMYLELENWHHEESEKQKNAKDQWKREKEFWDWQNVCGRMLKADAKERDQREAEACLDQTSRELQLQKQTDAAKLERNVAAMAEVTREHEDKKRRQHEARDAERAQDIACLKTYNREMHARDMKKSEEERERNNSTLQKKTNTEAHAQKCLDATAHQQAEHTDLVRRHDTQAANRQETYRTRDYLFQQMEEKRCKKEKDQEMRHLLANVMKEDVKNFTRGQEEQKAQRKQQNMAHRQHLEQQIREKPKSRVGDMGAHEIIINADLIRVAERALRGQQCLKYKDTQTKLAGMTKSISQCTFG